MPSLASHGRMPRLVFALIAAVCCGVCPAAPPNIVMIFCDDLTNQALSCYGHPLKLLETPHIDRLAREGMLFKRCLVPNSICGPSRAAILTGKYAHVNGFTSNGDRFDGSQPTFPKMLQAAGYQTAVIGKWHLSSDPTGFDHWHILPDQGAYYNPAMIRDGEKVKHEGYTTDLIADFSIEWLKNRDPKKPFLLMSQHKAPHREWSPALRHLGWNGDREFPEPPTLFDDYAGRGKAEREQKMSLEKDFSPLDAKLKPPSSLNDEQRKAWDAHYEPRNANFREAAPAGKDLVRWRYQRYMHDYLGCVKAVDEAVGRLLAYLDESGLAKDTIVLFSSDQGFYLGEHGWYDKRWIYEESLTTPLLVRWPGVAAAGTACASMVSILDFPETFLEAAGLPVPPDMHGKSLRPLLAGQSPADWRKSFYYHYYERPGPHNVARHYGVVTDRYKLFHFYEPELDSWTLIDREKDPSELVNVYDDPALAGVRAELHAELDRLRKELRVPEKDPDADRPKPQRKPPQASPLTTGSFDLPAVEDGLPGEGGLRRYDGYVKGWRTRREKWSHALDRDRGAVVFLGDSITQGWGDDFAKRFPGMKAANRGISGDTTRGMLIRLEQDVLALDPAAVVILAGTNDIEVGIEPEAIARNLERVVASIKRHDERAGRTTPIVLCRVFPSSAAKKRPASSIKKLNELIDATFRGDAQVTLVDTWTLFADAGGDAIPRYFPDLLHLNPAGYDAWAAALRPVLATLGFVETAVDGFVPEEGFESLFNGRDLTGWGFRPTPPRKPQPNPKPDAPVWVDVPQRVSLDGRKESPDGRYVVVNGRLVVTTPAEGRRIQQLWTDREFPDDFVLRLQFRATPNADSGVFIRQPQLQCRDYVLAGPWKDLAKYRPQDWNDLEVAVVGGVAKATCNGEPIPGEMKLPATGPIGLEGDRGQMEYRRIRIKRMAKAAAATCPPAHPTRDLRVISGWNVHLDRRLTERLPKETARAVDLLAAQLDEVVRVVPAEAVAELRKVPLWITDEYPGVAPKAEYHPDAGWLRSHGRDPAMARGVEFTNVRIFDAETRRMPNFALHELAHAFHHRVLPNGFDEPRVREAFERAKAGGGYERVERRDSEGRATKDRAYALTNPQEYFAETTEAFFSRNDFFPFDRPQLEAHDPVMFRLLDVLWKTGGGAAGTPAPRSGASPAAAAPASRTNAILFIADDVSWDDVGCYRSVGGTTTARTPRIDRLAATGRRFDAAILTASSCSPSRSSIITGRYPHNCGRASELHQPIASHLPWFPQLLREAGYHTALVGKNHMSAERPGGEGRPEPPAFDVVKKGAGEGNRGGHAEWAATIRERPRDKPFFFWFAAVDAHRGWDGDDEWREDRYGPRHDPASGEVPPFLVDDQATRADLASHRNEVTRFDHFVGEAMDELARQGILDDTLVIVMADNGRPFPRAKTRLHDSGMRTPFVVHWPRGMSRPGVPTPSLVSAVDIAPTILAAAGVRPPETMQGVSFLPVIADPAAVVRHAAFSEHNWHDYEAHGRAVRTDDGWLYVRNRRPSLPWQGPADSVRSPSHRSLLAARAAGRLSEPQADVFLAPRPEEELYFTPDDPHQLRNLAADPGRVSVLARMRGLLDAWTEQTRDSAPDGLSRDEHDRETGELLPELKDAKNRHAFRGTPAGSDRDASHAVGAGVGGVK